MAVVLCTGIDAVLTQTRKLILEGAGHKVVATNDQKAIRSACRRQAFDVAVIGSAATLSRKSDIASTIRRHSPYTKILDLYPAYASKTLPGADSWLAVPVEAPDELAHRVAELASTRTRKRSRPAQAL